MTEWSEAGIILRLGHFRESDIWLRILLEKAGIQTVFAFGGAKSRKRFCGCLDLFNTLSCRLKSAREGKYISLEEAELCARPVQLGKDWQRMGIAANCLRFTEASGVGPESASACFGLLENLRQRLENPAPIPGMMPLFFRLRLGAILGYAPDFEYCGLCGNKINPWGYFLIDEGYCLCPACSLAQRGPQRRRGLKLEQPTLDLLQNVQQNQPSAWPADILADRGKAARAIDGYVQYHLGLEWFNGNFRRI